MHCRPKMLAPIVHPTKCCVNNTFSNTVVPHVHPSHTTNVNHEMFQHVHYFPHSESFVNEVAHQHFNAAGPAPFGGPGVGGFPGPGVGGFPGPGVGGFPGPGKMYPGR
ncbi:spore coat protein CotH [Bacillus lacus]|uniref:Spore coat protein CotH n=1 Tax=Metabacillus lacus TaxID=1983721 RepID=A0A7X2IWK8_9BACI|nr:CotD family spore coat protein [Metabacillus lacus]MRX70944.1 spore coat protein CotH [Metabacillus lacus]